MKALSILQPWAWFILYGGKDIENRTWRTRYRGPLLIHAGKRFSMSTVSADVERAEAIVHGIGTAPASEPSLGMLKALTGGIVGCVILVDCVREHPSPWAQPGYWHWVLADPVALPLIPLRGALGLFEIEEPEVAQ